MERVFVSRLDLGIRLNAEVWLSPLRSSRNLCALCVKKNSSPKDFIFKRRGRQGWERGFFNLQILNPSLLVLILQKLLEDA